MKYEEMKVAELKEVSKERGLKVCTHGHKFTRAELIENLKEYDRTQEIGEKSEVADSEQIKREEQDKEVTQVPGHIKYAKTIEEMEQKYRHRKKEKIYTDMEIGNDVVFIHDVERRYDKKVFRKLRSAQVVAINRKKELVKVQLPLGDIMELSYEDLLYIKERDAWYPSDIYHFLIEQKKERVRRVRLLYGEN